MSVTKLLPEVTLSLLGRFSPYLQSAVFDFPSNSLELRLRDRIEQPTAYRVLRFEALRELEIVPHDPEDTNPNFIDSIIGAHRDGHEFHFHTDRFSISFSCGGFQQYDCPAEPAAAADVP
jgi:hypothetical protein